jgi:lipid A ethanolaminephosphotransferase
MSKHLITDLAVAETNDISLAKNNNVTRDKSKFHHREVNLTHLIIVVVLYLVATANIGFFKQVLMIYPFADNIGFIASLAGLLFGLMWLLFQLLCYRPTAKAVLIAMVLIAAVCGYFTDTYGTIFDTGMLINSLQTDQAEAMGLMAPSFIIRLLLLGVLPVFLISKIRIKQLSIGRSIVQKAIT